MKISTVNKFCSLNGAAMKVGCWPDTSLANYGAYKASAMLHISYHDPAYCTLDNATGVIRT